jgi:hypothetical protein
LKDEGSGRFRKLIVVGALAGISAWTKNEGAGVGILLLVSLLVVRELPLSSRTRGALAIAMGALPIILVYAWFKVGFAPPNDLMELNDRAGLIARLTSFSRFAEVAVKLGRRLVYFQDWALSWAMVGMGLFATRRIRLPLPERVVGWVVALLMLSIPCAFVVTPRPLDWHIKTSADRLLFQIWPCLMFVLVLRVSSRRSRS